jgi:hypothetical protein
MGRRRGLSRRIEEPLSILETNGMQSLFDIEIKRLELDAAIAARNILVRGGTLAIAFGILVSVSDVGIKLLGRIRSIRRRYPPIRFLLEIGLLDDADANPMENFASGDRLTDRRIGRR